MIHIIIIADCREDFPSTIEDKHYNDHYSLKSIYNIQTAILNLGYKCDYIGGVRNLIQLIQQDNGYTTNKLFFNLSDGLTQKNRRMQVPLLLELMDANYSGSDPFVVGVVNDKYFCNSFLSKNGIKTPASYLYGNMIEKCNLTYPVIVKPNREGSSIGIYQESICYTEAEIRKQIQELKNKHFESILIEEYISGYEVTNWLIGNPNHFVLNELIKSSYNSNDYFNNFVFGQEEKISENRVQKILTKEDVFYSIDEIKKQSEKIFQMLNLHDFARIDYRISDDGTPTLIEINSLPVISMTSEIGSICKFYKKSFKEVIDLIISATKERLNII